MYYSTLIFPEVVIIFNTISAILLLFSILAFPEPVSVSMYISFFPFILTFPDFAVILEFSVILNEFISMLPELVFSSQ